MRATVETREKTVDGPTSCQRPAYFGVRVLFGHALLRAGHMTVLPVATGLLSVCPSLTLAHTVPCQHAPKSLGVYGSICSTYTNDTVQRLREGF